MTQDHILVSPSASACPKPGDSVSPRFRPSDLGDTRHVAHVSQPARQTPAPSYPRGTITLRASVLDAEREALKRLSVHLCSPLPLFPLSTQYPALTTFFRKYLIFSLFSAGREAAHLLTVLICREPAPTLNPH